MNFIGTTAKLIPYFEELKKHILINDYSLCINILKNYNTCEQNQDEDALEDFLELHVMVSSGKVGMPCFVCRQMISEVYSKDAKVYCYSTNGDVIEHTVEELCPYPFGEDDLV